MPDLLLGLIGDNIRDSRAPALHRLAGSIAQLDVRYDRLIPAQLGKPYDEIFESCAAGGYRGLNITYPYKEAITARVKIEDPLVASMGAVNTVLFGGQQPLGFNTDYSGFIAAYRRQIPDRPPGSVLLIGAGGVGKAVAYALIALDVAQIHLVDREIEKAEELARSLSDLAPGVEISVSRSAPDRKAQVDGVVNCTPVGMVGSEGTPLDPDRMKDASWAFDAVYTPVNTQFLQDASQAGLEIISGYELFFFQGVHAWKLFSGEDTDEATLRRLLKEDEPDA